MSVAGPTVATQPQLSALVAGFVVMVAGLAVLTVRRRAPEAIESAQASWRALGYILVYGLTSMCFTRVIGSALTGVEHSPWLLALGDVMCVTLALFVWVMALAEGYPPAAFGLRWAVAGRMLLATLMGLAAAAVFAWSAYDALVSGRLRLTTDGLVFALLFASIGSALPEELLFRGFLMTSLGDRVSRWARVAIPALICAAIHALRMPWQLGLSAGDWTGHVIGYVLPLALVWGVMREIARGSIWPSLISHLLVDLIIVLERVSPRIPGAAP